MKMKSRTVALALSILLTFSAFGCSNVRDSSENSGKTDSSSSSGGGQSDSSIDPPQPEKEEYSFFSDRYFENGIGIMGMSAVTGRKNYGYIDYGGTVDAEKNSVWQLAQWSGKSDFAKDKTETLLSPAERRSLAIRKREDLLLRSTRDRNMTIRDCRPKVGFTILSNRISSKA